MSALVPLAFAALAALAGFAGWMWPTIRSWRVGRRTERVLERFARARGWGFERGAAAGEPPYLSTVRSIFGLCGELHARAVGPEVEIFAYRFGARASAWSHRLEAVGVAIPLSESAPTFVLRRAAGGERQRTAQARAQGLRVERIGEGFELWSPAGEARAARRWCERRLGALLREGGDWNVRCRGRWCVAFRPAAVGNRAPRPEQLEALVHRLAAIGR